MTLSSYRNLLNTLDDQIAQLVQSFCRSETYGYKTCKNKLKKLIHIKELLKDNFNIYELNKLFYSCTEVNGVQTIKQFNKLVGNKAELIVKTITKTTNTTNKFRFVLPTMPNVNGFYLFGLWINCKLETLDDVNKVLAILEGLNYLGFYNFQYDSLPGSDKSHATVEFTNISGNFLAYIFPNNTICPAATVQINDLLGNLIGYALPGNTNGSNIEIKDLSGNLIGWGYDHPAIYSNTSYVYTETFSYEYVNFDVAKSIQCVNSKKILKLAESI
jgi:hypothetical protein